MKNLKEVLKMVVVGLWTLFQLFALLALFIALAIGMMLFPDLAEMVYGSAYWFLAIVILLFAGVVITIRECLGRFGK